LYHAGDGVEPVRPPTEGAAIDHPVGRKARVAKWDELVFIPAVKRDDAAALVAVEDRLVRGPVAFGQVRFGAGEAAVEGHAGFECDTLDVRAGGNERTKSAQRRMNCSSAGPKRRSKSARALGVASFGGDGFSCLNVRDVAG
jgi:hypothetical protein